MSTNDNGIVAAVSEDLRKFTSGKSIKVANEEETLSLNFPSDILPPQIEAFIQSQTIQREYLAAGIIVATATAIGNSASLEAMNGYVVKCIIYLAIVAPPGASKSPALKKSFAFLEKHDSKLYEDYSRRNDDYKRMLAEADKNKSQKPEKPTFPQTIIKDSTIETVVKILSHNPLGCCVLADELSGFLNRMNQYKAGDEVQKWLEMWSSASILLQRITRDENKVENPFCNIVGGIQPGVLAALSAADNEHNGFYHRFLFVYPEPQHKAEWQKIEVPPKVSEAYESLFFELLYLRDGNQTVYSLNDDADATYANWFNQKNEQYQKAESDQDKGIIAKYQDYCLRFALLLQVLYDGQNRQGQITKESMARAIRLTEYFLENIKKAMKILAPETPLDGLKPRYAKLYNQLPEIFETKTALAEGQKLGLKEGAIKMFLNRGSQKPISRSSEKPIFSPIKHGHYAKNF